ncbi:diaminopimelate epimerase [Blochmannia endosymbiont of Polyrhachis (Hedomyrma) turneri]|uniref:diaminopimelate epimerase n=1 Tax=Blochmannia endosymbiont of Polyrhachis (Hedomyrma) turneri TaxID=1505596 RepID=UPI00061A7A2D|nr:diaminopimelate epimerase [Blochmannia endosymbiont of Polyrhachis (Hedomyrma) turneri]AKC60137.1 diaminopimelate epimerase [Blochmannia endosymbiont of Polyrhachis (Hedomyrma) turneri]
MQFSKMHGLGNDFMVVDSITQYVSLSSSVVRFLSDRHHGVGFDQLLLIESSDQLDVDFCYRIFNSDGQEVYQCANGVRCLAQFVHRKKLTNKSSICVATKTRRMMLFILDNEICVDMGEPEFDSKKVPLSSCLSNDSLNDSFFVFIAGREITFWTVSMGNPHCVLIVKDVQVAEVSVLGPILENYHYFPERANISFMEIVSDNHIRLRVHERGVGETRSCGSAACAAVSVGIRQGLLSHCVAVDLLGGSLMINWEGVGHSLYMYGPATHVYDGYIYISKDIGDTI